MDKYFFSHVNSENEPVSLYLQTPLNMEKESKQENLEAFLEESGYSDKGVLTELIEEEEPFFDDEWLFADDFWERDENDFLTENIIGGKQIEIEDQINLDLQIGSDEKKDKILKAAEKLAQFVYSRVENQLKMLVVYSKEKEELGQEKRAPFPSIFKYLWLKIFLPQLKDPQKKARSLYGPGKISHKMLGLTSKYDLFPEFYSLETRQAIVKFNKNVYRSFRGRGRINTRIRAQLRKKFRNILRELLLSGVDFYTQHKMGVSAQDVKNEYVLLSASTKKLLHGGDGGIESYYAVRLALLNTFGSPTYPNRTIHAINQYYGGLIRPTFLKGPLTGPPQRSSTHTHPKFNQRLERAENLLKRKGWYNEVKRATKGYWSATIRENGNRIDRLSQHSFGMAMDINAKRNPNIASWTKKRWYFVKIMLGGWALKRSRGPGTYLEKKIDEARSKRPEIQLRYLKRLLKLSKQFTYYFSTHSRLSKRIMAILLGKYKAMDYSVAKQIVGLLKRQIIETKVLRYNARSSAAKRYYKWLFEMLILVYKASEGSSFKDSAHPDKRDIAQQHDRLIKKLIRIIFRLKTIRRAKLKARKLYFISDIVLAQLRNPQRRIGRGAKKYGLHVFFRSHFVRELSKLSYQDRKIVSEIVFYKTESLLLTIDAKKSAKFMVDFLLLAYRTYVKNKEIKARNARKKSFYMGTSLADVAAYGFFNHHPKLVVALINNQGGGLQWLGISNNDMHHFQLSKKNRRGLINKV